MWVLICSFSTDNPLGLPRNTLRARSQQKRTSETWLSDYVQQIKLTNLKGGIIRNHDCRIESQDQYEPVPCCLEARIVKYDMRRGLRHLLPVMRYRGIVAQRHNLQHQQQVHPIATATRIHRILCSGHLVGRNRWQSVVALQWKGFMSCHILYFNA